MPTECFAVGTPNGAAENESSDPGQSGLVQRWQGTMGDNRVRPEEDFAQKVVRLHIQTSIGQSDMCIPLHLLFVEGWILRAGQHPAGSAIALIRGHREFRVNQDAEQTVSSQDKRKKLSMFFPAASDKGAIGQQESKSYDCRGDGRTHGLPTMTIGTQ